MKNFKVSVHINKVDFFKELLDSLNFVNYEDLQVEVEPRLYPGADFEIRSKKNVKENMSSELTQLNAERKAKSSDENRKDALSDIRDAMSKINKLRNKSH